MQGSVLGPIICSNQISKNSTSAYNKGYTYNMYKGIVPIPPLSMVDDIATISVCNNSNGNADLDIECDVFAMKKKLTFKPTKCTTVHVGTQKCVTQHVVADKSIERKKSAKYLADTISNNNDKLFEQRLIKARIVAIEIGAMASELGVGKYYHEIALVHYTCIRVCS